MEIWKGLVQAWHVPGRTCKYGKQERAVTDRWKYTKCRIWIDPKPNYFEQQQNQRSNRNGIFTRGDRADFSNYNKNSQYNGLWTYQQWEKDITARTVFCPLSENQNSTGKSNDANAFCKLMILTKIIEGLSYNDESIVNPKSHWRKAPLPAKVKQPTHNVTTNERKTIEMLKTTKI